LRRSNSQRQQCNFHASTPDVVDGFITSLNKAGIHILKKEANQSGGRRELPGDVFGAKALPFFVSRRRLIQGEPEAGRTSFTN
jgi:hypothetical protein